MKEEEDNSDLKLIIILWIVTISLLLIANISFFTILVFLLVAVSLEFSYQKFLKHKELSGVLFVTSLFALSGSVILYPQQSLFPQQASSPSSVKILENGEIPGFSDCLRFQWSDDPNEKISYCCREVRGTLRDGVIYKTCEKKSR